MRARLSSTVLAAALLIGACIGGGGVAAPGSSDSKEIPQPVVPHLDVAPESQRVDLRVPTFSQPTEVTNPLFPVSRQASVLFLGHVDGKPFRTEVTLLPETRIVQWEGQRVETRVSQYMAYLGGRIQEVAYDLYAQADDGSVWYFGEDVADFEGGAIVTKGRHLERGEGRTGGDDHARGSQGRERLPDGEHPRHRLRAGHRDVRGPDARRPTRPHRRWPGEIGRAHGRDDRAETLRPRLRRILHRRWRRRRGARARGTG